MFSLLLFIVAAVCAEESQTNETQNVASSSVVISYIDETNPYEIATMNRDYVMDSLTDLTRERIPDRIMFAKGTGAYGYFESTHDSSHICNAAFLKKNKKTPVAVRFSIRTGERGTSDLGRDVRGFAVKFYTDEGNLDLVGVNTPIYYHKDPMHAVTITKGTKRTPDSNVYDVNTYWDVMTLIPETLSVVLRSYSDAGIPASYRRMPGYTVHTFQVKNKKGKDMFVKFHMEPDAGKKSMKTKDAITTGATDPDYLIRDLYEAIAAGSFPSWTVSVQVMTKDDVKKEGPKAFDVTRTLDIEKYPLQPIGKLVLNKNAKHYQDEIDQIAFNPGNLVPYIYGAPDKTFEARQLFYRDALVYRLNKNYDRIPVNCPLYSISTYNRDGLPPLGNNGKDIINYYPNSFNGTKPSDKTGKGTKLIKIIETPANNTDQIVDFYNNELNDEGRTILIENLTNDLKNVKEFLQKRLVNILTSIHSDLGRRLATALNITLTTSDAC